MHDAIEEVLLLQTEYSAHNTEPMQRRGYLVRTELRNELDELIPAMATQFRN